MQSGFLLRRAVGEGHGQRKQFSMCAEVTCGITANHEHLKQLCPRMCEIQAARKSVCQKQWAGTLGTWTRPGVQLASGLENTDSLQKEGETVLCSDRLSVRSSEASGLVRSIHLY